MKEMEEESMNKRVKMMKRKKKRRRRRRRKRRRRRRKGMVWTANRDEKAKVCSRRSSHGSRR